MSPLALRGKLLRVIVFNSAPRTVAGLALALMAVLTPLGEPHTKDQPLAVAAAATSGRLLLPRFAGVHVLDLATGTEQALHRTPEAVLGAAWSPDGARVAYVQFGKEPGERYGGADIYVFDGSQAALALARRGRDEVLNNPAWTADGRG
jgi:hypothetical protein